MKRQRNAGFTLMEVMITLVIVAVLSAIALPSYQQHVIRSRLTEAFSSLSSAAPSAEQYWSNNRTYVDFKPGVAGFPTDTTNFTYSLSGTSTTSKYVILATGRGTVLGFNFTIDQSGNRSTTSTGSNWVRTTTCWVDHKDGTCVR